MKNSTDPLIPDPVTQYEIDIIDSQGNITTLRMDDPDVKWEDFFRDSGLDWEVHHVLPRSLFKYEGFAKWYENIGHTTFDINNSASTIRLEKWDGVKLRGPHNGPHNDYNNIIGLFCNTRFRRALEANSDEALASQVIDVEISFFLPNLKKKIINDCFRKPTYKSSGEYNQDTVNELLKDFDLNSLLIP